MDDLDQAAVQGRTRPNGEVDLIRSAFEAVPDAMILYDLRGKPLLRNQAYCSLVGYGDD
jgi:PAS domain S-box-containing protein